jgi:hypothetical protein
MGTSVSNGKAAITVFLACLVIYHANGRNHTGVDTAQATYSAWSLVRNGSEDLSSYSDMHRFLGHAVRELADGRWVSMRPLGCALAAVPFVAPIAAFRERPLSATNMSHLGKLTSATCLAAAAALFFLICRRLAPEAAWPATILFALGTCLWSVASQALWMHGPATFWLCAALYFLLPFEGDSGFLRGYMAGFALGMAILTRPTTAFFGLASGIALLAQRRWRAAFGLVLGGVVPVGFYCLISFLNFGDALRGGYGHDDWSMPTPLWLGLSGLLVAPSRGLLVYSPALLLAPVGIWAALRGRPQDASGSERGLLLAWLVAAIGTVFLFAGWHDWRGGWCYGPRFLCEALPTFCLFFAFGYVSLRSAAIRRLAILLVGLSVGVHFAGVNGASGAGDWYVRHDLPDQGRCLFSLKDTQIEAWARAMFDRHAQRLREFVTGG